MSRERGFTFIEVLVVTLVLAFGLMAFLQGAMLSLRLHRRSRAMGIGLFLAQEGLERLGVLGWDRVVAGRERGRLPQLMGDEEEYPQETVNRSGLRFLVVYARDAVAAPPAPYVVRCFWADGDRGFEVRNVVRLETRGR